MFCSCLLRTIITPSSLFVRFCSLMSEERAKKERRRSEEEPMKTRTLTWNPEPGTWNPELGTRNLEPET